MSLREIAAWTRFIAEETGIDCGCTSENISLIELRALRKVRAWLYRNDPVSRELIDHLHHKRVGGNIVRY